MRRGGISRARVAYDLLQDSPNRVICTRRAAAALAHRAARIRQARTWRLPGHRSHSRSVAAGTEGGPGCRRPLGDGVACRAARMIEEGVIRGLDARPGTAGRGGQAGLARGLRRPPAAVPGLAIRHRQDPAAGLPGTRHTVSGDGLRLAPPDRHPGYTPGPPPGPDTVHGAPGPGHPPPARRRPPCHPDRAAASRSPRSPPAS